MLTQDTTEPLTDDTLCACGCPMYLHDDGQDKCVGCEACEKFTRGDK